ncbi:hypothetical protein KDK95_26030 [Actinospica sp. MGRD01-02]|uniref:Uncharacterized protein n=1 Tax=Actinospica acidithermotolerans TaxID=2828514 RepID=A0A941EBL3_9ACTN|nr:hypothetical protein [Actinospica acidithermotolerans]MBR7829790.1 hypothetical protein [Actinospica acidithermotolerans]
MTAVYLPSQHASVHDLPLDPDSRARVLAEIVAAAIDRQQADGNFEDPAADDDIGDMSLGVISLLALAWHRGAREQRLVEAARRGVDHFLRERVYRTDNPGEPFLRRRDSGLPYARYMPGDGEHPFGDWPSTVWAMLHAVNIVDLGEGLLTEKQYEQVIELAAGYWSWLTEVSVFNPQQTANQAIGSIAAALTLARQLRARGRAAQAQQIAADARRLYADEIRARRIVERGFALPTEHGAGHDQNYVPISLTFLAKAYQESGDQDFLEDGDEIARHLETRLSVRGFDFGGPRYSEQHSGFEGTLGLRYFGRRINADLGRYLGDRRCAYHAVAGNGAPSGHFAFATVWLLQDESDWHRRGGEPHLTPYSVRSGRTSVTLTSQLTPYVVDSADSAVIEAVADHQHGIGPLLRYPDGSRMLLTRPLGPMRSQDAVAGRLAAKLVTKPVVTRDQAMVSVQQLVVCDGERVHLVAVLDRSRLPGDVAIEFLAGLPYLEAVDGRQRKILAVSAVADPKPSTPFGLGVAGAVLDTSGAITAGGLLIRAAAGLRVVNPPEGPAYFNSPRTVGSTLEQVSFALADDPRGYGDPDSGWHRVAGTNLVLADPVPDAPAGLAVFVVCYGPSSDPAGYRATAEATADGVHIHTPGFSALIGHPAGDEHGEPILALTPHEP